MNSKRISDMKNVQNKGKKGKIREINLKQDEDKLQQW